LGAGEIAEIFLPMTSSSNQPTPSGSFPGSSRLAKPVLFVLIPLLCLAAGLSVVLLSRNTLNIGRFFPPTPTVPAPTPPCVQPRLQLGRSTFPVAVEASPANGALPALTGKPGVVSWLDGTSAPYVFALDPTTETLALSTNLAAGDAVAILWGDCSRDDFQVSGLVAGLPGDLNQLNHSGVAALVLESQGNKGFMVLAARPVAPTETPVAGATEEPTPLPVDISFAHTTRSADGKTLSVGISVQNRGSTPLTLAPGDIALVDENGQDVAPASVAPALPVTIGAGASQALEITFPNPKGASVVFRLKSFTVELYPTNP